MVSSESRAFWNEVGSQKNFDDPFFLDSFSPYVTKESPIIEYGCGYGRLLNLLSEKGYSNLQGFDLAPKMLKRGFSLFPHLYHQH